MLDSTKQYKHIKYPITIEVVELDKVSQYPKPSLVVY